MHISSANRGGGVGACGGYTYKNILYYKRTLSVHIMYAHIYTRKTRRVHDCALCACVDTQTDMEEKKEKQKTGLGGVSRRR